MIIFLATNSLLISHKNLVNLSVMIFHLTIIQLVDDVSCRFHINAVIVAIFLYRISPYDLWKPRYSHLGMGMIVGVANSGLVLRYSDSTWMILDQDGTRNNNFGRVCTVNCSQLLEYNSFLTIIVKKSFKFPY